MDATISFMNFSEVTYADLRVAVGLAHRVTDRVHEVGLAETHTAVQEERVVRLAGRLGDSAAGGVSESTGVADHERAEGERRVEPRVVGSILGLAHVRIGRIRNDRRCVGGGDASGSTVMITSQSRPSTPESVSRIDGT